MLVVTTAADELDAPGTPGTGLSLREAVRDASPRTVITFDPAVFQDRDRATIRLADTFGEIQLNESITIDAGSVPGGVKLDGGSGKNRIFYVGSSAEVRLYRLILTGGNGRDGSGSGDRHPRRGGAISNDGNLHLTDCLVAHNQALPGGGAIFSGGALTLVHCAFTDNRSNRWGGAVHCAGAGARLSATNCTFTRNISAGFGGGALSSSPDVASVQLTHCTISGNEAINGAEGGGIRFTSVHSLTNCIVTGNTSAVTGTENVAREITQSSGNILTGDARLAPLADNGGPVPTMALLAGSPALDAATPVPGLATDARGLPRNREGDGKAGAAPDAGACEAQTPP